MAFDLNNLTQAEANHVLEAGRGREAVIAALKKLGLSPTLKGIDDWMAATGKRVGGRIEAAPERGALQDYGSPTSVPGPAPGTIALPRGHPGPRHGLSRK